MPFLVFRFRARAALRSFRTWCVPLLLVITLPWPRNATAQAVTTDRWDVSGGTTVTASSALHPYFAAEDMLGAQLGTIEHVNTVFADSLPKGTVHFVEWETSAPVTIGRFHLWAFEDDPGTNHRSFDHVRLLAFVNNAFNVFYEDDIASPYDYLAPSFLLRSSTIVPLTAQRFRAEFTQHLDAGISGPRVVELDGFPGNPNCADVNYDGVVRASDALITLLSAVGGASCEYCVCDVQGRDGATASDALRILQLAVGQQLAVDCPPCDPGPSSTTTTAPVSTSTTMPSSTTTVP